MGTEWVGQAEDGNCESLSLNSWRFSFLGGFQAQYQNEVFPESAWSRRRTLALLKLFLIEPGRLYTQDEIVELLFSDLDISKAIPNFQGRMSELRRVLEPDLERSQDSSFIETLNGTSYRLKPDAPFQLDIQDIGELLQSADLQYDRGNWETAAECYEQVGEIYASEFLPEDRYEDWSQPARERWRESLRDSFLNFAHCCARTGKFQKSLQFVDQVIASDPYLERAYRDRMLYSYLNGEQRDAQDAYQRCAQLLRQELGILPSRATRTLFERISEQEVLSLDTREMGLDLRSIAVLPFLNLTGDQQSEYFSDGLTEDIIAQIAQNRDLRVISRTSVMRFKESNKSTTEIGRELRVSSILEGSVRWSKSRVRVVVKLIRADNESPIWSEIYDQDLTDIFRIQTEVASQIASTLTDKITPKPEDITSSPPTQNVSAYQSYLKGRFFLNKRTEDDFRKSIVFFSAAIELDPAYALAYAGLADAYALLAWFSYDPVDVSYPKARDNAEKALSLNDNLSEAYASLAYVEMNYDWDWAQSESHFEKALYLNRNNVTARHWYAELLSAVGRVPEALEHMRYARDIDPLSVLVNTLTSWMIFFSRDYPGAIAACESVLELDSRFSTAYWILGQVYFQQEKFAEAIEALQNARQYSNDHPSMLSVIGMCHLKLDQESKAEEYFELAKSLSEDDEPNPIAMAVQALAHHNHKEAIDWLQIAYAKRSWYMPYIQVDPFFDPLKKYPEFVELVTNLQLTPTMS